jgi:hypothetical protein
MVEDEFLFEPETYCLNENRCVGPIICFEEDDEIRNAAERESIGLKIQS